MAKTLLEKTACPQLLLNPVMTKPFKTCPLEAGRTDYFLHQDLLEKGKVGGHQDCGYAL